MMSTELSNSRHAAPPDRSRSWDPDAFDATAEAQEWRKEESSNVTRLQDLSLGLNSDHAIATSAVPEEQWPFESSPCRWKGGKNTRGEDHAEMNAELFKSDFNEPMEFESVKDEASEAEDIIEEKDEDSSSSSSNSFSSSDDSSVDSFGGDGSDDDGNEKERPTVKTGRPGLERTSSHRMNRSRSRTGDAEVGLPPRQTLTRSGSLRASGPPTNDYNQMLAWNKRTDSEYSLDDDVAEAAGEAKISFRRSKSNPGERDELSSSCHGDIEKQRPSTAKRSSARKNDLSAATFHGPTSSAPRPGPSSLRRPLPPRTKSSDGAEFGSTLGAATLHGGSSVSRIRSGKRRTSSTASKPPIKPATGERRGVLKRAMSIRNVKRPEEYVDESSARRKNSGRERMHLQRSASSRTVTRSDSGGEPMEVDEAAPAAAQAAPRRRRSTSVEGLRRQTSTGSDKMTPTRQPPSRTNSVQRRDLLVLLREQKQVDQNDLLDKENRRLLHFLMYEHKMGISLSELQKSIRKEQAAMAQR